MHNLNQVNTFCVYMISHDSKAAAAKSRPTMGKHALSEHGRWETMSATLSNRPNVSKTLRSLPILQLNGCCHCWPTTMRMLEFKLLLLQASNQNTQIYRHIQHDILSFSCSGFFSLGWHRSTVNNWYTQTVAVPTSLSQGFDVDYVAILEVSEWKCRISAWL
jgi:hypothetical protein